MGAREAPFYGEAYGDGQGAAQEVKACEKRAMKGRKDGRRRRRVGVACVAVSCRE